MNLSYQPGHLLIVFKVPINVMAINCTCCNPLLFGADMEVWLPFFTSEKPFVYFGGFSSHLPDIGKQYLCLAGSCLLMAINLKASQLSQRRWKMFIKLPREESSVLANLIFIWVQYIVVPWGRPWYHKNNFGQIGRVSPFWFSNIC